MNTLTALMLIFFSFLVPAVSSFARTIPAIVSPEWLQQNLTNSKLVIVDIRSSELFYKSHIPGAIRAPFSSWIRQDESRMLELPSDTEMHDLLGNLGITPESLVVVVNKTDTDWNRADATRVAWTCIVSGVRNVSVLDGGYNHWLNQGKPVTVDFSPPVAVTYHGVTDRSSLISKAEVMKKIGHSLLLDARVPEDYFGIAADKGHIQSAVNLPAPWVFAPGGTFREPGELKAMASGVLGPDIRKEIIVYCEVGGFASTWWFLLSEVLGYSNVRLYDGSFQEWSADPKAPITMFAWH